MQPSLWRVRWLVEERACSRTRRTRMLDTQALILLAVIAAAFIALVAWFIYQRTQSQKLQQRFGPEYGRTVDRLGSQTKAEAELRARERRVEKFNIVPLTPADAARFNQAWTALQSH